MIGVAQAGVCSRAGCHRTAAHEVRWRNPRIHAADRVKIWLACDDHADYLRDFLAARDFPVTVLPHERPLMRKNHDA